jgi:hypothetical protein
MMLYRIGFYVVLNYNFALLYWMEPYVVKYVCIYIYILYWYYIYIYIYIYIHIYITLGGAHVTGPVREPVRASSNDKLDRGTLYVCMYLCMYVCMNLYSRILVLEVYVCMHACMYMNAYVYICMYICMYTRVTRTHIRR